MDNVSLGPMEYRGYIPHVVGGCHGVMGINIVMLAGTAGEGFVQASMYICRSLMLT